jgi:hypothetical protein
MGGDAGFCHRYVGSAYEGKRGPALMPLATKFSNVGGGVKIPRRGDLKFLRR